MLDLKPFMPPRMFGTAGIRGVTNRDITPELALNIAAATAVWMARRKGSRPVAALGHDTRYGAELLSRAAAAGFASVGCDVQFYGCVPTGVLALNLALTQADGGLLVTGSHLPPDRTGLIVLDSDGSYAPVRVTDAIEDIYRNLAASRPAVRPEDLGRLEDCFHPYEHYVSEYVQRVDARALRERRFKVVVDPANGPASYVAMELFQWVGCDVEMLNFDPSPIPGRASEPRAGSVGDACAAVLKTGADLGLALDVDADRALFIGHDGRPVSEDAAGALLASDELRAGDVAVTPITSSGVIERVSRGLGARLEYCPVGMPATCEAIRGTGAAYACEESGKYYFPRRKVWSDGLFSGLRMLEVMLRRGRPLAALIAELPAFHQAKTSIRFDHERRDEAVAAAIERLDATLTEGRRRDLRIDGLKRLYDDDSFLLVRASGTEPVIRVFADSPDAARAEALMREGEKVVLDVLRRLSP